uniref:Uncharacterized protein n=1 Tax=Panagrolaimus superbus TaxID=310955 RepID=A0A914YWM3_9BILA
MQILQVPSPEPPKSPSDDEIPYNYQSAKQPLSQQYSHERRPRVTSWFTDVGDNNKKDVATTIESSFMTPTENSKEGGGDHLDAREQYIKSKQYRDFMEPNPKKGGIAKKSSTKIQEKTMEDFNEKFAAITTSNENLEKEDSQNATKLSAVVNENYKLGTTPYTRKSMPAETRKESEEYLHKPFQQSILVKKQSPPQLPLTNNFDASHSSQGSYWSSQTELDKAFNHKKQSYTERAIDIGSYKASPVEVFDVDRKHSDTHSSGTLHSSSSLDDVEATPKAPRHPLKSVAHPSNHPPSNNPFDISTSSQSRRSIGVDDSPGTPIKYKIKESNKSEFHEMPVVRVAVKSMVLPQKGVITGIARPYSFQGGDSSKPQSREDLSSTPSRSISSLAGSSSQIRDSQIAESTASSTIRVDDIDRNNARSPLRDNSLMTTSTIVNMNSTSIRDWSSSSSSITDSRKESRIQNSRITPQKQGFDVIIRPRDSPIDTNRPQSVTPSTTTEFIPRYTNSSTTLTIKSSPDYSQNRHLSTQF